MCALLVDAQPVDLFAKFGVEAEPWAQNARIEATPYLRGSRAYCAPMEPSKFIDPHLLQEIFEAELTKHHWAAQLDFSRLRATDCVIYETLDGQDTFSAALWNVCFPSVRPGALWHYTTLATLQNIVANREVRLHTVERRLSEGDMTAFSGQFGLDGYLIPQENGTRVIDELAQDIFYLSLTQEDNPGTRWQSFGPVRLRLKVEPILQRAELRQIAYSSLEGSAEHPLHLLQKIARQRFGRSFTPSRISRAGAFFLPFHFEDEAEVRLVIKKFGLDDPTEVQRGLAGFYIAVPLDQAHERVRITLLEVQVMGAIDLSEIPGLVESLSILGIQTTQYQG